MIDGEPLKTTSMFSPRGRTAHPRKTEEGIHD